MKFIFDGKFYLLFDDGIQHEVTEQLWMRLMCRAKKETLLETLATTKN